VLGVVLAHRHDLAGQHRGQQPDVGQREPAAGELHAGRVGPERVPAQFGDDQGPVRTGRTGGRLGLEFGGWRDPAALVFFDHAIGDIAPHGEPCDTHGSPSHSGRRATARLSSPRD
jgi:hypothetical protein